jgi:hypothetical protein
MKKIILAGVTILFFAVSCVKENTPTIPPNNPNPVDTTNAAGIRAGKFQNGPYGSVNGNVKIFLQNNQYVLVLDSFSSSNGPDLYVYLSKEIQPINYISLGRLQAVTGNQQYNIPGSPDFTQYKYALVHCQRYNHLFGSAELR